MGMFDEIFDAVRDGEDKISGVVTGTVKSNWDKDHPGCVQVEMFLGEKGKNTTGWVPVMSSYAGSGFGAFFLPEVGDEVVIAFRMGDRNCPIIIGSIWSKKNKLPDKTAADKNFKKIIKTKGGCLISLDDEKDKQKIDIQTSKKTGISIDDEKQTISINDEKKKNSVTINAKDGSLTLSADKKMVLSVGGKAVVTIDGSSGSVEIKTNSISLNGQKDIKIKGQNTAINGTSVKISGSSSTQVSSNGSTQIKGTIVKIN